MKHKRKRQKHKQEGVVGGVVALGVAVVALLGGYIFIANTETPLFEVVGHSYPLDDSRRSEVVNELNGKYKDSSYVFFLGDVMEKYSHEKWQQLKDGFIDKIKARTWIIPGKSDFEFIQNEEDQTVFTNDPQSAIIEKDGKRVMVLLVSTIPSGTEGIAPKKSTQMKTEFDQKTQDFLIQNLKKSNNYDYVFILMHHNLWIFDLYLNYPQIYVQNEEGLKGVGYDVTPNNWYTDVVPYIDPSKTYVIAGDSTKTMNINYRGIDYITTGIQLEGDDGPGYLVVKLRKGMPQFYEKKIGGEEKYIDLGNK